MVSRFMVATGVTRVTATRACSCRTGTPNMLTSTQVVRVVNSLVNELDPELEITLRDGLKLAFDLPILIDDIKP
ncbi:hypothetical protein PsorP6_010830 [Peronosclerospora sorghi]|uniref:Uncharacterized protein n=1 Tax=Peronosclerospora sorghi TaxID=230839 RepID=A0ACC0VWS7_9STRA|nr:hypothetical protein PsorP6_010830 [Peronosclerospora sorghi]